jgi:tetratricopeptide (TPR) repeat protein
VTNSAPARSRFLLSLAGLAVLATAQPAAAKVDRLVPGSNRFATLSGSYLAARSAIAQRDVDAASTYFQTALVFDPDNPQIVDRTFPLMLAAGRLSEALPLADRVVARDKGNQFARLALGTDALKKGRLDRAKQQFAAMTPRPLMDLASSILQGWSLAAQGDVDQALRTVDRITGPDWYKSFRTYHAGLIADVAGRRQEALKRLGAAYAADPGLLRIAEAYARALARSGDKAKALSVLADFDKIIPEQPMMVALKTDILADKAVAPLIPSASAGAAEFLYGLGAVVGRDGGEDMASIFLQLSLHLEPKSDLAIIALGTLRGKLRALDDAIAVLGRVPEASPMYRIVQLQIGRFYNIQQKPEDARRHIQIVVDRDPKDVDAAMALADVLRVEKRYVEAAAAYTKAIENSIEQSGGIQKTDWSLYYYRGTTYERSKQWAKAEPDFLKALELNPNEADVLNYLGYSWVDMGQNLDRGLNMIKQAVELQPDNGYIVDSLGWAYYRLGRYEEAVTQLEKAVLLRPEDPTLNDHLGDAYWKAGRKLEAQFQWNHARDLKPDPNDLPRILKKIAEGLKDDTGVTAAQVEVPAPPKP